MCTSLGGQAIRRATSPASDIERATKLIASRGLGGSDYVAHAVHRTSSRCGDRKEPQAEGQGDHLSATDCGLQCSAGLRLAQDLRAAAHRAD